MRTPLFILAISLATTYAGCIRGLLDYGNLTTMAEEVLARDNYTVTYATHYIFTSLEFNCSGAVTGWGMLALDNAAKGRPEMSVWTPAGNGQYTKRGGVLLGDCSGAEEVGEGTQVYLHRGRTTQLLQFQPGDVLGMLVRQQRSSDFAPLVVEGEKSTGYLRSRNGVYETGSRISPGSTATSYSPLLSLTFCVNDSDSNGTYPNCSEIELPSENCVTVEPVSPSTSIPSPSPSPSISTPPPTSQTSLPTWALVVVIVGPCVLVVLVVLVLLAAAVVWRVRSSRKDKVDFSPRQTQSTSTLPMMSYDTPFPATDGNTAATHTYETPLGRPMRPFVTISCDDVANGDSVIVNHTRSGSNTEASVYEEPMVSVPQYDSILGAQHHHVYDALISPDLSQPPPPVFSRHNSPHLQPSSSTRPQFYHTLERSQCSPSPSPPQNRAHRPGKPLGPLATRASQDGYDYVEHPARSEFRPHTGSISSQRGSRLPPTYQIIPTSSNLRLNSGVYVPTHQQRCQFSQEPIFDDSIYADLSKAPNSPLAHNWSFFVETEHYWKPASDKAQLFNQLHTKKFREINRKQIQITEHLGSGEFGTVCKGFWHTKSGSLEVAIKMAQNKASEGDKVRFLQEAATLGQFLHPNIVRLHGVVTVNDPAMILLELMKNGDLKTYLRTLRPAPGEMVQPQLGQRLLRFCSEVALGLEYLAKKSFVHRDIAARNILLTDNYTCKIADFGMSRDLEEQDYYRSTGGMVPFKWTAPEALHYRKYSSASDVWSYGVLLWEIWSLGHIPYKDCNTPEEATAVINGGARLLPPPGCPRALYKHMMECWNPKSSDRPTFTDLVQALHLPSSQILCSSSETGEEGEEGEANSQANTLGADLEAGHSLYLDLQVMYSSISV